MTVYVLMSHFETGMYEDRFVEDYIIDIFDSFEKAKQAALDMPINENKTPISDVKAENSTYLDFDSRECYTNKSVRHFEFKDEEYDFFILEKEVK